MIVGVRFDRIVAVDDHAGHDPGDFGFLARKRAIVVGLRMELARVVEIGFRACRRVAPGATSCSGGR
jgi:hypothetical protein